MLKEYFLLFLIIINAIFISAFIHESVHWIQFSLDNKTKPVEMKFDFSQFLIPNAEGPCGINTVGCVRYIFKNETSFDERMSYMGANFKSNIEYQAYGVQIIYVFISTLLILRIGEKFMRKEEDMKREAKKI